MLPSVVPQISINFCLRLLPVSDQRVDQKHTILQHYEASLPEVLLLFQVLKDDLTHQSNYSSTHTTE